MPGIFLSHSSKDKSFVRKLAIDLVNRDFPVWYDNWEMETGHSLTQRIFDGIDNSSYLVIVLSPNAVESAWVKKELNAALVKEEQLNRQFVLPVKIAECNVPLQIGDRLYANFSDSYLDALEQFTTMLKRLGATNIETPREQRLIPLCFTKGIYLKDAILEKRVKPLLVNNPPDFSFKQNQLVVEVDNIYSTLRQRLIKRMETIENDPFYSPEFERSFTQHYHAVFDIEEKLLKGTLMILNGIALNKRSIQASYSRACHWFARIQRSKLYAILCYCQDPNLEDVITPKKEWYLGPLGDNFSAQEFFGAEELVRLDIGPSMVNTFSIWADLELPVVQELLSEGYYGPLSLRENDSDDLYSRYVIPQMVSLYLDNPDVPLTWDFNDYLVGIR